MMLFKNRSFLVKVVDDKDTFVEEYSPINYNEVATEIAKKVTTMMVVYIAADTLRRIIVYAATSRI